MRIFQRTTADKAWVAASRDIGNWTRQESRAGVTLERTRVALLIRNPRQRWVLSRRPAINPAFAVAELAWILAGDAEVSYLLPWNSKYSGFVGSATEAYGAYGKRLRSSFGVDQILRAGEALAANPTSRQVVLQLYHPALDLPFDRGQPRAGDIPCNVTSLLKVRDGKLEWTQMVRSNDFFLGVPYNIVQFTTLQEVLAGLAGVEVGSYLHYSDSLHLYERDWHREACSSPRLPHNKDDLRLSEKELLAEIESFHTLVLEIGRCRKRSSLHLLSDQLRSLQTGWRNMAWICVSERARRLRDEDSMQWALLQCGNAPLRRAQELWVAER